MSASSPTTRMLPLAIAVVYGESCGSNARRYGSSDVSDTLNEADGGRLPTSTVCETTSVAPWSSVTWSRTVCVPGVAKLVLAVALVPSSKLPSLFRSHAYEAIEPSGSDELDVKVTSSPVLGLDGLKSNEAVGLRLPTLIT